MKKKVHVNGLRPVVTKTGKNAGRVNVFFTVTFQYDEDILIFTGWRLFDGKIHPPAARWGFKFLNLCAVDSKVASEIYFELKKALAESDEFRHHELSESISDGITLITARKAEIKKFIPELV